MAMGGSAFAQTVTATTTTATVSTAPAPQPEAPKAEGAAALNEVLAGKDTTGSAAPPPRQEQLGEQTLEPGEKRPVPDYANRPPEGLTAGEFLIWIPRTIFFPVHLALEYLVRWPLVSFVTWAEKVYLFKRIQRFLTWRDGKSGVYPTFLLDFGLQPSVGLTTFHRDFPATGNTFNLGVGTWGPRWINARLRNTTKVLSDDSGRVDVFASFLRRPDFPFYGIGSFTRGENEDRFRYQEQSGQAGIGFSASLGGLHRFRVSSRFRDVNFGTDPKSDEEELRLLPPSRTADPTLPGPILMSLDCAQTPNALGCVPIPGFNDPEVPSGQVGRYQLIDTRMALKIDTRDPDTEFHGGTGYLLELVGSFNFDPSDASRNFVRWSAETAGFYDFTGRGHVILLRIFGEFISKTGGSEVPFTELASLGGSDTMRAYLRRRFLGDSVFTATLSYRYPVWSLIDSAIFAEVGNAYNGYYGIDAPGENFAFSRLYLSAGLALRTSIDREYAIQALIAVGTNRLDSDPVEIDTVRLTIGFVEGF